MHTPTPVRAIVFPSAICIVAQRRQIKNPLGKQPADTHHNPTHTQIDNCHHNQESKRSRKNALDQHRKDPSIQDPSKQKDDKGCLATFHQYVAKQTITIYHPIGILTQKIVIQNTIGRKKLFIQQICTYNPAQKCQQYHPPFSLHTVLPNDSLFIPMRDSAIYSFPYSEDSYKLKEQRPSWHPEAFLHRSSRRAPRYHKPPRQ